MKRETSAYERVMFHYSNKGPMYFAFKLNIRGSLTREQVSEALIKTADEYPLATVRVEKLADKRQFITTDDVPEFTLTVKANFTGEWSDEVVTSLQEPFDNEKGPMARFKLLQSGDENSLIAVFHHAVCDGVGALIFLEEFMKFLSNPAKSIVIPDDDSWAPMLHKVIHPDNLKTIEGFGLPEFATDKGYTQIEVKEQEPVNFPCLPFALQSVSLSKEETSRVVLRAKESGVTVHAYAGALILQCFAEEFGPQKGYTRTIQSPINFRPQLVEGAEKMFGLFNGLVTAECDCSLQRSTAEIAHQIKESFQSTISSLKPLSGYYNFMEYYLDGVEDPELLYENREERGTPMNYDFSFSNLGRVSLEQKYGDFILEEIYGPVFSAAKGERVIGAVTFQGRLFMTLIYDSACFDHEIGVRIWQNVIKKIKNL
ncbi:MAG: condensation domain-containing protein [Spirochaetes bacterium]|jgi:NRPS condensation-like uncharacterized protein|nr:condensation domain-containing protein [Spirochaetota bacterium]